MMAIVWELLSIHVTKQKNQAPARARLGQVTQEFSVYGIPLLLFAELLEALATGLNAIPQVTYVDQNIVVRSGVMMRYLHVDQGKGIFASLQ